MSFEKFIYLLDDGLFWPKSSLFEDQWEGLIPYSDVQNDEELIKKFSKARDWIYVSCWHMESAESYAMWKIYGEHQYSVCVWTTESKIRSLLYDYNLLPAIYAGEVVYAMPNEEVPSNYFSTLRETKKVDWWYALNHFKKHKAYTFEQEYRFIAFDEKFDLELQNTSDGITLKMNPREIIEAISVSPRAPEWFYKIVSDVTSKYGLSIDVKRSRLDL